MNEITASQVMRYRHLTGYSIMGIKRYLQSLPPEKLSLIFQAIEIREQEGKGILRDPKEKDPTFFAIFQLVEAQVTKEVEAELKQQILELEKTMPEFSDIVVRRGMYRRIWYLTKQKLQDEYHLDWMTPAEMNPFTIFD